METFINPHSKLYHPMKQTKEPEDITDKLTPDKKYFWPQYEPARSPAVTRFGKWRAMRLSSAPAKGSSPAIPVVDTLEPSAGLPVTGPARFVCGWARPSALCRRRMRAGGVEAAAVSSRAVVLEAPADAGLDDATTEKDYRSNWRDH